MEHGGDDQPNNGLAVLHQALTPNSQDTKGLGRVTCAGTVTSPEAVQNKKPLARPWRHWDLRRIHPTCSSRRCMALFLLYFSVWLTHSYLDLATGQRDWLQPPTPLYTSYWSVITTILEASRTILSVANSSQHLL